MDRGNDPCLCRRDNFGISILRFYFGIAVFSSKIVYQKSALNCQLSLDVSISCRGAQSISLKPCTYNSEVSETPQNLTPQAKKRPPNLVHAGTKLSSIIS